jgi:hypothetical protein
MMVAGAILAGMMARPARALEVCASVNTMRDWGLRRAWKVEPDCDHPERPARLVEIPWVACEVAGFSIRPPERTGIKPEPLAPPAVRSGMQVILRREGENAQVHLTGRALGAGRMGDRVVVQAGLGMTRLTGIVRGAGVVELPQKVGQ